jgi:hypothetical protein
MRGHDNGKVTSHEEHPSVRVLGIWTRSFSPALTPNYKKLPERFLIGTLSAEGLGQCDFLLWRASLDICPAPD